MESAKNQRQSPEVSMRHSHNAQFARGLERFFSIYIYMCVCVTICVNCVSAFYADELPSRNSHRPNGSG